MPIDFLFWRCVPSVCMVHGRHSSVPVVPRHSAQDVGGPLPVDLPMTTIMHAWLYPFNSQPVQTGFLATAQLALLHFFGQHHMTCKILYEVFNGEYNHTCML